MNQYKFPCGCSIPIDESLPPIHGHPSLIYPTEAEDIPLECETTWQMLSEGQTKGIFQLESPLGRQWTKRLKPGIPDASQGIEHLAALGALLRPGVLRAKNEKGISMTEVYCRRKNGEEQIDFDIEAVSHILGPTYSVMCYQEQMMAIAKIVAGFNDMEVDKLRKAAGKKDQQLMADVGKMFIERASNYGVINKEQAEILFDNIKKSGRYLFNRSHSVCYAYIGYNTAHLKAHFPLQFYTSFLYYAKEKQDPLLEIRQLVNDAKASGIEVLPPRFEDLNTNFNTDGVIITFGLSDVKGIGAGYVAKMRENMAIVEKEVGVPRMEWGWLDFLTYFSPTCSSNIVKRMIEVGSMARYKMDRQRMLAEYEAYKSLTDKEQHTLSCLRAGGYEEGEDGQLFKVTPDIKNVADAIEFLLDQKKGVANKNRREKVGTILKLLRNPPRSLVDAPEWIAKTEEECLGIPITCNRTEGLYDLQADTTCKEFREGKDADTFILAVDIQECRDIQIQNGDNRGKKMAFLVVCDQSGSLEDVCMFSEAWEKYGNLIHAGTTVELKGRRDAKRGSFIVEEVWRI